MLGSSEANQRRHWTAEFLCCFISCKLCTCTAYMLKWISSSPDASFPPWSSSQRPFSVSLHLIEHLAGSVARGGRAAGVVRHWVFRVLNNVHGHSMLLFLSRASPCWLHTSAELSPPCGGHYRAASASVPPCRPETSAHALAIVLLRAAARVRAPGSPFAMRTQRHLVHGCSRRWSGRSIHPPVHVHSWLASV
mgnify:CR=1 FL=1